jgi:hypothetical protein
LFFRGVAALRRGDYETAVSDLEDFLKVLGTGKFPASPFAAEEARVALVSALLVLGNAERLQKVVVESYWDRPHSMKRFPLRKVFALCDAQRAQVANRLYFPVVAYLACDDPHKISRALKAFLDLKQAS